MARLQLAMAGQTENEHLLGSLRLAEIVTDLVPDGTVEIALPETGQIMVITVHILPATGARTLPAAEARTPVSAVTALKPQETEGHRPDAETAMETGDLIVQREARRVWSDGAEVALTYMEYELLDHLMTHPGRVLSRNQLMRAVWAQPESVTLGGRTVDVHVHRLRRKLGRHGARLVTVKGVGYAYRPPDPHPPGQGVVVAAHRVSSPIRCAPPD